MSEIQYNREEIIWKYIDGQCTKTEKKWVGAELQSNPSFQEMYQSCLGIHKSLQKIEYESPSVRFVQNVIEALPPVARRKTYNQLIPAPVWKWGLASATLILIFALIGTFSIPSLNSGIPLADGIIRDFVDLQHLPAVRYIYWISIAACSLLILDYFHQRRVSFR